jgi:hypothetical protein
MDIHAILEIPKGAKHPRAEVTELLKNFPTRARFRRDNCKGRVWSICACPGASHSLRRVPESQRPLNLNQTASDSL